MTGGQYVVRQTDCRTGWQVVSSSGKVEATYRRHEAALDHSAALNRAGRPAPEFDPRVDYPERYGSQS